MNINIKSLHNIKYHLLTLNEEIIETNHNLCILTNKFSQKERKISESQRLHKVKEVGVKC